MKWNDIDLETWRAYEFARARYALDPAQCRRSLFLSVLWNGLLALLGICFFLFILGVFAAGAVIMLKDKTYHGVVFMLFGFGLFFCLLMKVFFQRSRPAGMSLDPEKFGRLYDEVEQICRDLNIAPIRRIYLDLSARVTVVSRSRNTPRIRRDTLVVGYPLVCAMDARSFRICLMRALQREKAPGDALLTWLGRVCSAPTGNNPFVTGEIGSWDYVKAYRNSMENLLKLYVSISPLQRVEERNGDASCREAFGARDFAAAMTRARFLSERCDPQTLLLRCLAEGDGQHLASVIRDEVRKTLPEAETNRLLGRMISASEAVMETRPAFRERVGTDEPAVLLSYLQDTPDAAERYFFSCAEFEAEFDAWLEARIRKAKTDEFVRRLKEKEEFDESSSNPAVWTAALDAAARLGHAGLERDLLEKAVEKFPDHTLFRGKQLARRIRDADSDEEELDAADELEHLAEDAPALVLEFHSVLYDFAVRWGDSKQVMHLLAARESAEKGIAQLKRGKKNSFLAAMLLVGMLVLLPFEGFLLIQLLTSGNYGFRGYFIGGAHVAVFFCWVAVQDRKERRKRKEEKAPAPATAFDDTAMFPSPEPEEVRPVEINPGGFRLSPNWLFGVLFALLMLAGVFVVFRGIQPGQAEFNAGKAAYKAGDCQSALEHYKLAADRGNLKARTLVGLFYMEGMGIDQDYAEAVKWLRPAAEQGFGAAQLQLGKCYAEDLGIEQDHAEAVKWYRKAAEQGVTDAQILLAVAYGLGRGVGQDDEAAFEWMLKAARQGDELAQYHLAVFYRDGRGVKQSDKDAAKWFKKAAKQGHIEAQFEYASCCEDGRGVKQSDEDAAEWFRKAAEQGHVEAQARFGNCCLGGKGVKQDYKQAVYWFRKAAEQGSGMAMCGLGACFYAGFGVKEDRTEGIRWWRFSAEQGFEKAEVFLRAAAEDGDAEAQKALDELDKSE